MARNDEGEFELVLGNRQLMSVMFILVVLLGVFFTMGYIVGRSNPGTEKVAEAARDQVAMAEKGPPTVVEPGGGVVSPPATPGKPSPATPPVATPEPEKPVETKPAEPQKAEQKTQPPPAPAPVKPAEPARPPAPPAAGPLFAATPTPGLYLQVAAIDRPGANGMAEAYRKQGFNSLVTNSSSPTLFRVIIGPLAGEKAVSETKQKLEALGVKGAILRKF